MSATTTPDTEVDELYEALKEFIGRSGGPGMLARDPVNEPMIRHWCDAMGNANPVHTDPEIAATSVHGGIVAPATMLQVWNMAGLGTAIKVDEAEDHSGSMRELLNDAGYGSVVATNCEQEYFRYLRPGDVLTVRATIDDVSPRKETGLGTGYFTTNRQTYTDQHGEVVGTMLFRTLWFTPRNAN